ncbi:MAG: hypothetical protein SYC29_17850, partial [Planctomycetota bacterium]|nr:hypothetical protein [Planctomycetota bacterium]
VLVTNDDLRETLFGPSAMKVNLYMYASQLAREDDGTITIVGENDLERLGEETYSAEWDRIVQRPECYYFIYTLPHHRHGLWARTSESRARLLRVYENAGGAPVDDIELRRACIEHLIASGEAPDAAELLKTGVVRVDRILWFGWIVNLLTVLSLATLLVTSPLQVRRRVLDRRAARRLARGFCPTCAYPLPTGESVRCPECGWGAEAGNERQAMSDER